MRITNLSWIAGSIFSATLLCNGLTAVQKANPEKNTTLRAEQLVRQQASAVQTMREFIVAHRVDVLTTTPKYNQTTHTYLTTWARRPDLLRIRSQRMGDNETIVADAQGMWIYRDADRVYWHQPGKAPAGLMESAFPGLGRELSDVNLPNVMTSASISGQETLTIGQHQFPCTIVDVTVAPKAAGGTLENNQLRLWISTAYKVPLKVRATFLPAGSPRAVYTDLATIFEPNAKIANSAWTFIPPVGSKPRPNGSGAELK